jgi:hypothetical protein
MGTSAQRYFSAGSPRCLCLLAFFKVTSVCICASAAQRGNSCVSASPRIRHLRAYENIAQLLLCIYAPAIEEFGDYKVINF